MARTRLAFSIIAAVVAVCGISTSVTAGIDRLTGVVIGRTGEVIHISLTQPVRNGTIFKVMEMESEPPIAEAKVIECSQERPFVALAKVTRGDIVQSIATGVHAYTDPINIKGTDTPRQLHSGSSGINRISIQAGVFQPSSQNLRDTVADNWESYRLNYSFIKAKGFEAQLSTGYDRGAGSLTTSGGTIDRKIEVFPAVITGKIKPLGIGGTHLTLGGGGGLYRIKTSETGLSASTIDKPGFELSAGLESRNGWMTELRYRKVEETDIEGYSLSLGSRF